MAPSQTLRAPRKYGNVVVNYTIRSTKCMILLTCFVSDTFTPNIWKLLRIISVGNQFSKVFYAT